MIVLSHILVATDFGAASEVALVYGRAIANQSGACLHLLHVAENPFLRASAPDPQAVEAAERKRLDDRLTPEDRRRGARAIVTTSDEPAGAIVGYAKAADIDLIVMGTHGRTGVAHAVMGSVAERVVRTASCPVLTTKHREDERIRASGARPPAGDIVLPPPEPASPHR